MTSSPELDSLAFDVGVHQLVEAKGHNVARRLHLSDGIAAWIDSDDRRVHSADLSAGVVQAVGTRTETSRTAGSSLSAASSSPGSPPTTPPT